MQITLAEIAEMTGGRLAGDGARVVTGVASLTAAGPEQISFVTDEGAAGALADSRAGAVVAQEGLDVADRDAVFHASPRAAMATLIARFHPPQAPEPGVSPHAVVHSEAELGEGVSVGPFAVVEAAARIGAGCVVGAHAVVGRGCEVGAGTVLHPHAVLYAETRIGSGCVVHAGVVLGATGFGFVVSEGRHAGIPQVGGVEIGDDVEIGANTCIDCGTLDPTRVGDNTKIDDLVMIGHNSVLGRSVILCGQTALAGSTVIDDWCVFAGSAGSAGHLHVGEGVTVAGRSVVTSDVEPGSKVGGYPHQDLLDWHRTTRAATKLPQMARDLRDLRQRVAKLEASGS